MTKKTSAAPQQVNFQRLKQGHWSRQETDNAQTMANFIDLLMNRHDFARAAELFGKNGDYLQHNRGIADGIPALIEYIQELSGRFPEYGYDVKQIMADGDKIIFHSHVMLKAQHRENDHKGLVIVDIWRLKEGRAVEHWDAIQPLNFLLRILFLFRGGHVKNHNGVA